MPIGPGHAFADGGASPRPSHSSLRRRLAARLGRMLAPALEAAALEEAWRSFLETAEIAEDCLLGPEARCVNDGDPARVRLGPGTVCRGIVRRERFGDGTIEIGRSVYVGDDCLLSCADAITIGDDAMLAHGVQVFDNSSHPLGRAERARDWRRVREADEGSRAQIEAAPVTIAPGAWLGFNSIVLMGVTVGEGAIVGAGSVVTEDVPPETLAAGAPARVVASLEERRR